MARVVFHKRAWNDLVRGIIDGDGVRRMRDVADACNTHLEHGDGYMVSTEGDEPLSKHSYRATVITASAEAMRDNAKNNRLVHNFYRAGD